MLVFVQFRLNKSVIEITLLKVLAVRSVGQRPLISTVKFNRTKIKRT